MKKKVIAFCPADENNLKYYEMMKNSLRKFHTEEELPLVLIGPERLKHIPDPQIFYRMTPFIGKDLIHAYDLVIKLDADQVITAPLTHIIEDDSYDVACVLNSNPKEPQYRVWDIMPHMYMNCGLVAMRSQEFLDHWWSLCIKENFQNYQMREQDFLNILFHYGNYRTKCLDMQDKFHGLASKGYWQYIELNDKKELILKKAADNGYPLQDKQITVIHFAGGNDPSKMKFKTRFQPDVVERLEWLVK